MMRIITGKAKGKKLFTLEGDATRPTSERIKGAIFSAIQFDIEGRRVLDIFAGSGQMGLEALSRGAVSATFIDSSREAMEIVKKNANATSLADVSKFIVSDGANYLRKSAGRDRYDLVFIDPPYAMNLCKKTVEALLRYEALSDGAIVVLESGDEVMELDNFPYSAFEVIKSTSYGKKTSVNILLYRKPESTEE